MKQDELQSIVSGLVDELRELPDHTKLTTWQLMDQAGYMDEELSNEDLMDIDYALRQAARKAHIILDSSKHDGIPEGLPFNLDYIVKNAKAQIRCPRCGSMDTARILYGLPAMDDELEERIRAGKIHLGGCCITSEEVYGERVRTDSTRFCNACEKKFGAPPIFHYKGAAQDYRREVIAFRYFDGGYFGGYTELRIRRAGDAITAEDVSSRNRIDVTSGTYAMPEKEWAAFMDDLYSACYLHEWKKRYDDPGIMDGEQWEIELTLPGNRRRAYYGSNNFPPYWKDLQKVVNRIIRKCKA